MMGDRWSQVDQLLQSALTRSAAEREDFVRAACGDDAALRDEALSLLTHADSSEHFMEPRGAAAGAARNNDFVRSGTELGPYRILDVLGAGGMGIVYRAHDTRLDRQVAIKVLMPDVASSEEAIARFEREAKAVAALSHPNIMAIYDFSRDGQTVFAVMEFLDGRTLRALIEERRLPVRKAVTLGMQIAQGLAAAHDRNIVHRDLKPENIGLTRSGQVKILDFGLARQALARNASPSDSPTNTFLSEPGLIMGTVGYMSPEQVRGQDLDHRSDLFSFGAVLYEAITGRRAFQRATAADTLTAVLHEDPPDLADSGAKVPPALDRVIRRCLEKHPEDRFHSARDLAFALDNALAGNGSGEVPVLDRRRRRMLAPAAVVAGSLAVGFWGTTWLPGPTEPASVRKLTLSGVDREPAASPPGDRVAYASMIDGEQRILMRIIGEHTRTDVAERPVADKGAHRPRFYYRDNRLLFLRPQGRTEGAFVVDTDSLIAKPVLDNVVDADPAPSGNEIAFVRLSITPEGSRSAILGILDTRTKKEDTLIGESGVDFASVRWSPDGRRIAAIRRSALSAVDTSIVVVDAQSKKLIKKVDRVLGAYGAIAWAGDSRSLLVTESPNAQVFVPGALGSIVKIAVPSGRREVVLRQANLFGQNGSADANATIDVAGHGRLVFSTLEIHQNLRECHPIEGGGCAAAAPGDVVTTGDSSDRQPAYSPDGRFMIFSSNRGGDLDLWVQSTQDGKVWPLTHDAADDWDPAFTPDGKAVLWSSNRHNDHLEIWMAAFDGTRQGPEALTDDRQVSHDGKDAENPTMTPDGWIVYSSTNESKPGIWKVRPDGRDATRFVPEPLMYLPDVSPNGNYVAYLFLDRVNLQNSIRVAEVAGGRGTNFEIKVPYSLVASGGDIIFGRVRWWPDGEHIVFVGQDDRTGRAAVYRQRFSASGENTDATRTLMVASLPDAMIESLAVKPDRKSIAVSDGHYRRNLVLAEHVPGIVGRLRK